jgi:hypothetical protein
MLRACLHFLLACNSLSLPLFSSLSFSLTNEQGAHTLFTGQRERERERETEREGGRGRGEGERE